MSRWKVKKEDGEMHLYNALSALVAESTLAGELLLHLQPPPSKARTISQNVSTASRIVRLDAQLSPSLEHPHLQQRDAVGFE